MQDPAGAMKGFQTGGKAGGSDSDDDDGAEATVEPHKEEKKLDDLDEPAESNLKK